MWFLFTELFNQFHEPEPGEREAELNVLALVFILGLLFESVGMATG